MARGLLDMGNMIGSYIAAVTAFSVVNLGFLATTVRWLWPTMVGVPAIIVWITYYKIRFTRRKTAAAAAT